MVSGILHGFHRRSDNKIKKVGGDVSSFPLLVVLYIDGLENDFLSIYYDLCNRIKLLLNETLSARLAGFLPLILQWGFPLLLLIWFPYSCLRIWEFPIHKSPCGLPLLWHLGHLNFYGVLFLKCIEQRNSLYWSQNC